MRIHAQDRFVDQIPDADHIEEVDEIRPCDQHSGSDHSSGSSSSLDLIRGSAVQLTNLEWIKQFGGSDQGGRSAVKSTIL